MSEEPCTVCVMRGFNPVDVNPMDYGDEVLRCPHCGGSGVEPVKHDE
jgi:hypothetical protein